jgi:hypothetical protein
LEGFFECHSVSAGRILLATESAEATRGNTNIRRIDVAIDVEVRLVTVHTLTHGIRQPADGEDVSGAVEREGIVSTQTLLGKDFIFDRVKPVVVGRKSVALKTMTLHRLALKWVRAGHQIRSYRTKAAKVTAPVFCQIGTEFTV